MTTMIQRMSKRQTRFGIFHNFDAPHEETGYVFIHLFVFVVSVLWERSN